MGAPLRDVIGYYAVMADDPIVHRRRRGEQLITGGWSDQFGHLRFDSRTALRFGLFLLL